MQLTEVRVYLFFHMEKSISVLSQWLFTMSYSPSMIQSHTQNFSLGNLPGGLNKTGIILSVSGCTLDLKKKKTKKSQIRQPLPYLNKKEKKKISKYFVNLPGLVGRLVLSKQFEK